MKRCKECGSHRGMLEREAMWHRNTGSAPVDFWFRDTDYGYDSTRLAVAESELMMGSVAAWYTEADAEACENWEPTSVTDDKRQRVTKMARKKMSASAKLRWAKRRQAQAAE